MLSWHGVLLPPLRMGYYGCHVAMLLAMTAFFDMLRWQLTATASLRLRKYVQHIVLRTYGAAIVSLLAPAARAYILSFPYSHHGSQWSHERRGYSPSEY